MKIISMAALLSTSIFIQSAFAANQPQCPSPANIIAAGIQGAEQQMPIDGYVAYRVSNYGTPYLWNFRIYIPRAYANSAEDALAKGKAALQTLTASSSTPINPAPHQLQCAYSVAPNLFAVDAWASA